MERIELKIYIRLEDISFKKNEYKEIMGDKMKITLKKNKISREKIKEKNTIKSLDYKTLLEKIIINDIIYELSDLKGKKLTYVEKLGVSILFKSKINESKEFMEALKDNNLKNLKDILRSKNLNFKNKNPKIFIKAILSLIQDVGVNNMEKVILKNF